MGCYPPPDEMILLFQPNAKRPGNSDRFRFAFAVQFLPPAAVVERLVINRSPLGREIARSRPVLVPLD